MPTRTQKKPEPPKSANRPVHEVRLGRIKAAIWANETDVGVRHNVTITRIYKDDKSKQWHDTTSFRRDDLPLVAKVADLAHTWIYDALRHNAASNGQHDHRDDHRHDEAPY